MSAEAGTFDRTAAGSGGPSIEPTQILRFPAPKPFGGKDDDFEQFSNKLKSYLALSNPAFRKLMNDARDADDQIDFESLADDHKQMAVQLQNALISLTEGPAAKLVQTDEDTENGFETWRRLNVRYTMSKRSRATGRMHTILTWNFNYNDFETSFKA